MPEEKLPSDPDSPNVGDRLPIPKEQVTLVGGSRAVVIDSEEIAARIKKAIEDAQAPLGGGGGGTTQGIRVDVQ